MAQVWHPDRVEVFAFHSTGLAAALAEAAGVLLRPTLQGKFDEERATLSVDQVAGFSITLPYKKEQ